MRKGQQPNSDHVVMDARTGDFWCRHCDARHKVKMPLPISDFVSQSKAFTTLHAKCTSPIERGPPIGEP